jgi:lipoate-protein ligase A
MVDFKGFTKPIIDYLTTLGLNANFGGHNSIMVNNFKVSGNAEHIYRNRVLHHGTLLFNANLEQLEKCLYTNRERFTDRAVRSVRANVSNISTLLNNPISIEILATNLFDFISKSLSTSRYSTTEWNLGYSPKYELPIFIEIDGNNYTFQLKVENGVIVSAESESNLPLIEIICSALLNCQHEPIAVIDKFKNYGINDDIANRIIEGMF